MKTILILFIIIAIVEFVMIVNFVEDLERKEDAIHKLYCLLKVNAFERKGEQ